jgi:hypothetical protein
MDFIIVPIQPEYAKEEVYQQLTDLARSLGVKPNKYVEGTEDEKYSLITEMLSAIIRKELQIVRLTRQSLYFCDYCNAYHVASCPNRASH